MAKILIVEDEKAINDLVKFNLELVGHNCYQVFDDETGLEEALKLKYDLIILDVMLPKCSGFEIMEQIKGTPVIFVTARSAVGNRFKGLRPGADDYITKSGVRTDLKPKEFNLLAALVTNRNIALSREKLSLLVWDYDYEGDTRTVNVRVQRLRQKLDISERIKTVYKTGYRFEI